MPGRLSTNEFNDVTDSFLSTSSQTEHAHNSLVCAILYNVAREKPEHLGPAIWVTAATDKSSTAGPSKPNIASDAGEQRLKVEVMALPARDRRRLKGIGAGADKVEDDSLLKRKYEDYYQAGKIRVPENVPPSAGGLNKTNWDLEIRKRYTQPLFSETLEFPDAAGIFSRMVPICYEESVASGSSMSCAELVAVATETYVKDLLSSVFNRTRANGPKYENGAAGGVSTSFYLRQLEREEHDLRNGKIQKGRDSGLLPVENREAIARRPIGIGDLKVAGGVGRGLWNGMPLIGSRVAEAAFENEYDDLMEERQALEAAAAAAAAAVKNQHSTNAGAVGIAGEPPPDEMDIDDDDYGWAGGGAADREALGSLLEDCLSIRA
jgi:transcriptional coactivator HFI1/ADA1